MKLKRFWFVGVLTLMLALVALGFLTGSAQAASGVGQAETPPDPQLELLREQSRQRLERLNAELDAALAAEGPMSKKGLDMFLDNFFNSRNIRIRNSDTYYERRDNRWENCYAFLSGQQGQTQGAQQYQGGSAGMRSGWCTQVGRFFGTGAVQGQGTGTQQGAGTGTQQGQGTGTQQGQGTGTQQGQGTGTQQGQGTGTGTQQGQGTYEGRTTFRLEGASRSRARFSMDRCRTSFASGSRALSRFATRNGAAYDDVVERFCGGADPGDLALGYWVSNQTGVAADVVFNQRASGMEWQDIISSYDLRYPDRRVVVSP